MHKTTGPDDDDDEIQDDDGEIQGSGGEGEPENQELQAKNQELQAAYGWRGRPEPMQVDPEYFTLHVGPLTLTRRGALAMKWLKESLHYFPERVFSEALALYCDKEMGDFPTEAMVRGEEPVRDYSYYIQPLPTKDPWEGVPAFAKMINPCVTVVTLTEEEAAAIKLAAHIQTITGKERDFSDGYYQVPLTPVQKKNTNKYKREFVIKAIEDYLGPWGMMFVCESYKSEAIAINILPHFYEIEFTVGAKGEASQWTGALYEKQSAF